MTAVSFRLPANWPAPYDEAAAARLIERFTEIGRQEARLRARPAVAAMLAALGGNSPYLSDLAFREAATIISVVRSGPDKAVADAMAELAAIPPSARRPVVTAGMRRAKRVVALATAIADIGGIWRLDRVTNVLASLAESTLRLTVAHLLRTAQDRGELNLPNPDDPAQGCGFVAIGMGKLGARELNYSSDIDLILLYDPTIAVYTPQTAGEAMGAFTSRLARDIVTLMEARDADGYVFRTDLRLRPDPAATPPAIALPAALTYYESLGQNWERAAMIKARQIGGDRAAGDAFLRFLRPFIWRRHLDFAAIQDIHSIKRQINAHRGGGRIAVAGHNIKLGRGGIREIEFFIQTQQLIWGGRDPQLRGSRSSDSLAALGAAGHVAPIAVEELGECYRFLRVLEHRLQMIDDKQTQTLPEDPDKLQALAIFMGFLGAADFSLALTTVLRTVEGHYARLFENAPALAPRGNLVFTGAESDPETLKTLTNLGFAQVETISARIRGWHHGRVRATHSARAREMLTELTPALLAALARTGEPDTACSRFDSSWPACPRACRCSRYAPIIPACSTC